LAPPCDGPAAGRGPDVLLRTPASPGRDRPRWRRVARARRPFEGSLLDIAQTADERTLILGIFVYISLLFTLLTIPFRYMLKRELERCGIAINLGRAEPSAARPRRTRAPAAR
jgi:hypothetical protein